MLSTDPEHVHTPDDDEPREDENYLTWLAEQQITKQSEGELAGRQALIDALSEVHLDFRNVAPREQDNGHTNGHAPRHSKVDTTKAIDVADLLKLNLPPLKWVVPDLIPEGTTLVAAPPKIGKSSLIYQVCGEVALGGQVLGRTVAKGSVLYAALEDGPRRGQAKVRAMLHGRAMPRDTMTVWWNAPTIGAGLEEALVTWMEAQDNPVLIAIDTLERVRPDADTRKESAYRTDVRHLTQLQDAFRNTNVALVIVHHARKEKGDDFVQAVSGTYGLTGSVDTIVSIERKRNDPLAIIRATGREVGEIELPARLTDKGLWEYAAEALAAASSERLEVFDIIRKRGPIWPAQIAKIMGREGDSARVSVQQMVTKMVAEGVIGKERRGYCVSPLIEDYSDYSRDQKH